VLETAPLLATKSSLALAWTKEGDLALQGAVGRSERRPAEAGLRDLSAGAFV
jgi:hypothetical protein